MYWIFFFLLFQLDAQVSSDEDSQKILDNLNQQRYNQAMNLIKQAYVILNSLKKDLYNVTFSQALENFKFKKYSKAKNLLLALIKKEGEKVEYLFLLAECLFLSKDIKKSAVIYNKIISTLRHQSALLDSNLLQLLKNCYFRLIDCFEMLNQTGNAIEVLKEYLIVFPDDNSEKILGLCARYKLTFRNNENFS